MKFQCFICKGCIEDDSLSPLDPCSVNVYTNIDQDETEQKTQTFFCHFECLKKVNNDDKTLYLESISSQKEMELEYSQNLSNISDLSQILYDKREELRVWDKLFNISSGTWVLLREILGDKLSEELNEIEELLLDPIVICWTEDYSSHLRSQNRMWKVIILATEGHYEYAHTLLLDLKK